MWSRPLLAVVLGLLAGLFDATIAPWISIGGGVVHLALPLVVLLAAFSTLGRTVTAAIAAGILLDLLLPSFGLVTFRLAIVALLIRVLSQGVVTNRSVTGSVALGCIGLAADRAMLFLITVVRQWGDTPFVPEVTPWLPADVLWMCVIMVIVFFLFAAFTKRFMPLVTRR